MLVRTITHPAELRLHRFDHERVINQTPHPAFGRRLTHKPTPSHDQGFIPQKLAAFLRCDLRTESKAALVYQQGGRDGINREVGSHFSG